MFGKASEKMREVLYLETGIHIAGNRELVLENCRRIEECSDVFMCMTAEKLTVKIWGSDLRAYDFNTGGIIIRGKITQIELEERRRRNEKSDSGKRED